MERRQQPHTPPSIADGDGVRIVRRGPPGGGSRRRVLVLALSLAVGMGAVGLLLQQLAKPPETARAVYEQGVGQVTIVEPAAPRAAAAALPRAVRRAEPAVSEQGSPSDYEMPSMDPDDLSHYISPGDPVPTMGEVIDALHDAGIHEGIGAFNPPGTSPPLQGLAVAEDFDLPEGYVRHYQVTDDGEPIEPILMFSPDFEFYDESGDLVEIPADRVVPPELAPPGMPIRPIEIPSP